MYVDFGELDEAWPALPATPAPPPPGPARRPHQPCPARQAAGQRVASPLPETLPDVERLSGTVLCVRGGNRSFETGPGTNTYLVGNGRRRALIDSADGNRGWRERLVAACEAEGCEVGVLVLTHRHGDHAGGADWVSGQWPESTLARLADGLELAVEGATLRAVHTPGHCIDHWAIELCEERAVFTGDLVLGEGTVMVLPPPLGCMDSYLSSLLRIGEMAPHTLHPGHGTAVRGAALVAGVLAEYVGARLDREQQLLECVRSRTLSAAGMVQLLYSGRAGFTAEMARAAEGTCLASLHRMQELGLVRVSADGAWCAGDSRPNPSIKPDGQTDARELPGEQVPTSLPPPSLAMQLDQLDWGQFDRDGYLFVKGFASDACCKQLYEKWQSLPWGYGIAGANTKDSSSIGDLLPVSSSVVMDRISRNTQTQVDMCNGGVFFHTDHVSTPSNPGSSHRGGARVWHQDSSFFSAHEHHHYVNFYLHVMKEDPCDANLEFIPFSSITEPSLKDAALGGGASSYYTMYYTEALCQKLIDAFPAHHPYHSALVHRLRRAGIAVEDCQVTFPPGCTTVRIDDENDAISLHSTDLSTVAKSIDAEAGDLLLLRGDVIHRTGPFKTHRVSLSARFVLGETPVDKAVTLSGTPHKYQMLSKRPSLLASLYSLWDENEPATERSVYNAKVSALPAPYENDAVLERFKKDFVFIKPDGQTDARELPGEQVPTSLPPPSLAMQLDQLDWGQFDRDGYLFLKGFASDACCKQLYEKWQSLPYGSFSWDSSSIGDLLPVSSSVVMDRISRNTQTQVDMCHEGVFFSTDHVSITKVWHQDSSFFSTRQHHHYVNFYLHVMKEDPCDANLEFIPFSSITEPSLKDAALGGGASSYYTEALCQRLIDAFPAHHPYHSALVHRLRRAGIAVEDCQVTFPPGCTTVRIDDDENDLVSLHSTDLSTVAKSIDAEAGDLLLLRGDVIHRTGPFKTHRVSLSARFVLGETPVDKAVTLRGTPYKYQVLSKRPSLLASLYSLWDENEPATERSVYNVNAKVSALPAPYENDAALERFKKDFVFI